MGRSNETFGKKEVRAKKEKKRKNKEQKRQERKGQSRDGNNLNDMIAYVDEFGKISSQPPESENRTQIKAEDIEIGVTRNSSTLVNEALKEGIVLFFNESRRFGIIKEISTGQDIFVHANSLSAPIKENDKVTFEIVKGLKGPNAVKVRVKKD